MAVFKNDPFPGTDYSQYLKWKKVTTPSGQVLYIVPGNEAYVYDPVASNASGRKVFRANPSLAISKQQEEEDAIKQQRKQQEQASSPLGQATPVIAGTGGVLAANEIMKHGFGNTAPVLQSYDPKTGISAFSDGTVKNAAGQVISGPAVQPTVGAPTVAPAAAPAAPPIATQSQAAAQGASGAPSTPDLVSVSKAPTAVGSSADGGTLMSDGSVQTNTLPPGATVQEDGSILSADNQQVIGRVAQGALGAYQIYQGFNELKTDKIGGGLGIASGGVNVASAAGYKGAGAYAGPLMAAKGAYDTFGSWQHGGQGIRGSAAELGAGIGTMVAPGVGTLAGALIGNAAGYGLDKLGLFHKTTRQVAQGHTSDLLKTGTDDEKYQTYVKGMREQYNAPPPDPSKPFHGQYASWGEYKSAGLDASDLTGVYGNIKAYGPGWASLTEDQRRAVTQANIDSDLYTSKKGEVEITDETKAKENFDKVMKGFEAGVKTATQPTVGQPPVVVPGKIVGVPRTPAEAAAQGAAMPPRSKSTSPGMMNGQRIYLK